MGRVIHFEIHADEPKRAMAFYEAVLGWRFQKFGDTDYWFVVTGSDDEPGINGGLMPRNEPLTAAGTRAYVCTVQVGDIDACEWDVIEYGGSIETAQKSIPGVGLHTAFKDSEGNVFGALQAEE